MDALKEKKQRNIIIAMVTMKMYSMVFWIPYVDSC